MLTKAEVVGGNAANGAGSAVANVLTTKALESLLGGTILSQPAQIAIMIMQRHFFAEHEPSDFITPLRRTGFYLGKEPFKKTETISYLGNKIAINHRRLSVLTNTNLKEAATQLWDLHCEIAMHMIHRRDATFERSDADHSYVLMYLQESIAAAFDQIINKHDLTDEDVRKLKVDVQEGIVKPFYNYIQNTQPIQSTGARRTAIAHQVRESIEKVCNSLDRFITEKPLRTSINALQHKAQSFNIALKQMLLAIVLVPRKDAEKQQDVTWVLQRKMILSKAVEVEQHVMLSCLQTAEVTSIGFQGKLGLLYANPLAARVTELVQAPLQTRDQLYFNFILEILELGAKPLDGEVEFNRIAESFSQKLNNLPLSQTFVLNDILRSGISEHDFIYNSVLLYRQTYELARFMAALQRFMQLVGKLGLYNNPNLHAQLTHLIQSSLTSLERGLHHLKTHIREGAEARVGGWLGPIDELFQIIKNEGGQIISEMRSFQTHFAKIIDPSAMQMEFHKSKQELLQAALGLGYASQISASQMEAIRNNIGDIQFIDFSRAPTDGVNINERMQEILNLTSDMGKQLEEAKAEMTQLKVQCETTGQELSRVHALMCEHEESLRQGRDSLLQSKEQVEDSTKRAGIVLGEIDQVVESFVQNIIAQLRDLDTETQSDVEEANRLIASSAITLAASSSASLSEQMTFLSGIKSKLEERQRSYKKIIESVSKFQKEYIAKRGQMTLVLTNIQEATKDIERTVIQLMAKISALTDIISSLRGTLEKKDKQLAEQKVRLEELEAQLSALKVNGTNVTAPPTTPSSQNNSLCFDERDLSSRYFKRSSFGFFSGDGACNPSSHMEKISKALENYRHDIQEERFVNHRPRKVIKYAIWSELYKIIFQKSEVQGQINTPLELVLAAIQRVRAHDVTMNRLGDVYTFNKIVETLNDKEIYAEFVHGTGTFNALAELEPTFNAFLQERSQQMAPR